MTPIQQIAADIAPELDRMIESFLNETDLHKKQNVGIQIRQFLWDNKVGLLRIAQAVDPSGRR